MNPSAQLLVTELDVRDACLTTRFTNGDPPRTGPILTISPLTDEAMAE